MRGVRHRTAPLWALLVYVALDLSLPGMPGAFVFEPGDSVESVQGARARGACDVVVAPAEAVGAAVPSGPPAEYAPRLVRAQRVEPRGGPVRPRPFLAYVDQSPPSEDPH
jgi:hypothetical protein